MAEQQQTSGNAVQTTGHAWDGDLQEFNNPLPNWWLWTFYATIVFALVYWVLYPAWPIGKSYTKGINTITFVNDAGEEVTTEWNTRARLIKEMQSGEEALKQQAYLKQVGESSYEQIQGDAEMMGFVNSMAKGLFGDNCAACHGVGGTPAMIGQYPNLGDDAWLWGGSVAQIEKTIVGGRVGYMPGFAATFSDEQLDQVTSYVLSLSGHQVDAAKAAAGQKIFQGETGGCYYCHTKEATGMASVGSANLTDAIWTVADVPGAASDEESFARVRDVIKNGVQREMPAWEGRLSAAEIKLLTVYVHSLGGGQ
jgi:cytochrome c oxidase cbb3-type subunit 3